MRAKEATLYGMVLMCLRSCVFAFLVLGELRISGTFAPRLGHLHWPSDDLAGVVFTLRTDASGSVYLIDNEDAEGKRGGDEKLVVHQSHKKPQFTPITCELAIGLSNNYGTRHIAHSNNERGEDGSA